MAPWYQEAESSVLSLRYPQDRLKSCWGLGTGDWGAPIYFPPNFGSRFSMKAVIASPRSSDWRNAAFHSAT